jgi:uncharacterized membrane protein YtjA (UPF0391 family)
MYKWAFFFAVISLISAILGFGGLSEAFADIALFIFIAALITTIFFFILGWKAAKKLTDRF